MRLIAFLFLIVTALSGFRQVDSTLLKSDTLQNIEATNTQDKPVLKKSIVSDLNPPSVSDIVSVPKILWAITFLVLGYVLIRLITKSLSILAERSTHYRITIKSFIPVVKILGWIGIVFIVIAAIFKPPAATILAFSASIGVAVGFASQDILKNIFGGVMILFDRPFQVGDKIEVSGFYGEVVEIGLRSTRIVTADDSLVSIPNSEIMNKSVSNANSGESNCQVVAEIYLPIDTDTKKARALATQAAMVSRFVYLNKPITVIFANEYKERQSLLKMKVKAYVHDIRDEFKFKSEMTELIIEQLIQEDMIDA